MSNLDQDIVVSTRVRLARNFEGVSFGVAITPEQEKALIERVQKRINRNGEFKRFTMNNLSSTERAALVERHLISRECAQKENGTLFLSKDEQIAILVNEEDHLRIQCIEVGFQLEQADTLARAVDAMLCAEGYAYDVEFGYLTACPTNVGTGMRASVMLHLPVIVMTGSVNSLLETVSKFGYTLRGFFGEGTSAAGDMFQLSNQVTLGVSEEEIISNLSQIVHTIVERERELRVALMDRDSGEVADRLHRSLGILKYAIRLNTQEMMQRISDIKLGISLGLFEGVSCPELERLTIDAQPATIALRTGGDSTPEDRDTARAGVVSKLLENCRVAVQK